MPTQLWGPLSLSQRWPPNAVGPRSLPRPWAPHCPGVRPRTPVCYLNTMAPTSDPRNIKSLEVSGKICWPEETQVFPLNPLHLLGCVGGRGEALPNVGFPRVKSSLPAPVPLLARLQPRPQGPPHAPAARGHVHLEDTTKRTGGRYGAQSPVETALSGYSGSRPGPAELASGAGPPWAGVRRSELGRLGPLTRHRTRAGRGLGQVTSQPDTSHGPDTLEKPRATSIAPPAPSSPGF